jgi:hypothetical protein
MTDRRSQVRVRASEADGPPTGEYAAVAFPVQPERWRHPKRYISAAAPVPSSFLGTPDRSGTGGVPGRSLRFIGLPAGDYYLIAVDDIEYRMTYDPAVLQKLSQGDAGDDLGARSAQGASPTMLAGRRDETGSGGAPIRVQLKRREHETDRFRHWISAPSSSGAVPKAAL